MTFIKSALPILSLSLLIACADSHKKTAAGGVEQISNGINQNEMVASDGSNIQGIYAAELYPINYNLHLKSLGTAALERNGDSFSAFVHLKYGPKNVTHKQAIYTGRRCPNLSDDLNKDAFIDIHEALFAIGQISIPLDENLDSQEAGMNSYPRSNDTGKFFYSATASFDRMFSDLKSPDLDPTDILFKLPQDEGLTFPGRVVLIQGLAESHKLPETVATQAPESAQATIPMACGVLWKVEDMPTDIRGI